MKRTGSSLIAGLLLLPLAAFCTELKRLAHEGFHRGGFFTFRLADAAGPDGRVYAVDINARLLGSLNERARKGGYQNVETVLAAPEDPRLPLGGIDLIFTSETYHHLKDRSAYFVRAKKYLTARGRVAIIDHKDKGLFARLFGHWTSSEVIRREMEAAGYRLEHEYTFLPNQNFLVFTVDRE